MVTGFFGFIILLRLIFPNIVSSRVKSEHLTHNLFINYLKQDYYEQKNVASKQQCQHAKC